MEEIMEQLASFVSKAQFVALPQDCVHETKRVLLDSIGCAIGGLSMDRGKIAVELAGRLGGRRESTIIGTSNRVGCVNAAFANGELINALDYDAMTAAGHSVPAVVAASLALVEGVGASGKDLILAIALGHEISNRFHSAAPGLYDPITAGPDRGMIQWPSVYGYSDWAIAAAVAAGKIINLNQEKTANAIGLAGYVCPPNTMRKWTDTTPVRMTKYGLPGWGAQAGVTSALLAEMGYIGDTDVFSGEHCFWRYTGSEKWDSEMVLKELGREWSCHKIVYKQYPAGRCIAGVLDIFIRIMEENGLQPEDIEKVKAIPHPIVQFKLWQENKLRTPEDFSFNAPYLISCAAYRINSAHWLDADVRKAPKIREFMQRVDFSISIEEKEFGLARLQDPSARRMGVEVVAKGKTFRKETIYLKGSWQPEEFRNTDEELIKKFRGNVSRVLSLDRANKVAQTVLELEKLGNAAELMEIVVP